MNNNLGQWLRRYEMTEENKELSRTLSKYTGMGLITCKRALAACGWDYDKAMEKVFADEKVLNRAKK
jgi:translation elongation factor EF-Ts